MARTLQDASSQSADSHMTRSHDTCRLQIRLPDGRVLRQSFPTSASLSQIVELVMESCSDCGSVQLIQVSGWCVCVCAADSGEWVCECAADSGVGVLMLEKR